jgi:hypothetical protein
MNTKEAQRERVRRPFAFTTVVERIQALISRITFLSAFFFIIFTYLGFRSRC